MFKLTLQIGLYDQNLVRKKEDFDIKSDLIYSKKLLKSRQTLKTSTVFQKFQLKQQRLCGQELP